MTPAPMVVLLLLAQGPPGSGSPERFKVTLEYYGVWGLATEAGGACPGGVPGTDTLVGNVVREVVNDEGTFYAGNLTRTTNLGLCEERDTANGSEWCAGEVHGDGTFKVRIMVPPVQRDEENLRIELKPGNIKKIEVGGNCSSLDNAAVADQYRSGDTILFETSNRTDGRVPPNGTLVARKDVYSQTRRVEPDRGYTLKVEPVP